MKHIVILGAGFGGLRAAIVLAKGLRAHRLAGTCEVTLVNRASYHTYTPLLYEVATASKEVVNLHGLHDIAAYPLEAIARGLPVKFVQAEAERIDLAAQAVHLKHREALPYDYLVLAMGSEVNYFNIPGAREYAMPLKTFGDAIRIRDAITMLAAEKRDIAIAIVGGGPTGVEVAGELRGWCAELSEEFKNCRFDITLVEATGCILPGFSSGVVRRAKRRLAALGVRIIEQSPVAEVRERRLAFGHGGTVPFDLCIWAAGVKAPLFMKTLAIETESHHRAVVSDGMECVPHDPALRFRGNVYAIGDSACVLHPERGTPMPGVARAAIVQGEIAAHNILSHILRSEGAARHPAVRNYHPKSYPYIIPIGGKYAIAKIGRFVVSGFWGWVLKGLVELNYLRSIMLPSHAFKIWFKGLRIFAQNDRLG